MSPPLVPRPAPRFRPGRDRRAEFHPPPEPVRGETDGPGERHVVVARGRDYADVPPLKGVYSGGGSQSLVVVVEVTRLS